jgi:lysophospholipase L1-like esterase
MSEEFLPRQSQERFWRELLGVGLIVGLFFMAFDGILCAWVETWAIRDHVLDLQSPTMLHAKIDFMRRHTGFKVALLGDSVILGLSLKEHGDPDWKKHSLGALLSHQLTDALPGKDILVMNLGLNGALPQDLAHLARHLCAAQPDLTIADLGLRAFSADFDKPGQALSRPWLETMTIQDNGDYCEKGNAGSDRFESWCKSTAVNRWKWYALRDTLQGIALAGTPRQWCEACRNRIRKSLTNDPPMSSDLAELVLLMKASRRFANIQMAPEHRQCQGLEELLRSAQEHRWKLLLFYARENPAVRDSLLDPQVYEQHRQELREIIQPFLSAHIRYHEGAEHLTEQYYLDHVHMNAHGNLALLDTLWPEIRALVR